MNALKVIKTVVMNLVRGPTLEKHNEELGERFRRENGTRPGVLTTPTGLQIEMLQEGTGSQVMPSSTVTVHYTGTLIDGTPFDSSHGRGAPLVIRMHQSIEGWQEGLRRMRVGGRARLVIPPELAYGRNGAGPVIGAGATLVFEIEVLQVQ